MSTRRDALLDRLPTPAGESPTSRLDAVILDGCARLAPHEPALWAVALAGLVLDIVLTAYGLSLGLTELNPVARDLMAAYTPLGAMVMLKSVALVVGLVGWVLVPRVARAVVPACLAVPWWIAVGINATLVVTVL
jgi:predicted anti-sigma-YlaC factor YlaD